MSNPYAQISRDGLWSNNIVFAQVLALCPTLAVTGTATNGLGMGLATTAVLVMTGLLISLLRNVITPQVRIPAFIIVIAMVVTLVEMALNAWVHELYKVLGLFIALIVVNCAILGRAESFAAKSGVLASAVDGLAMGFGFTGALTVIGLIREFLGAGTVFANASGLLGPSFAFLEMKLPGYGGALLMILPPGGFAVLGFLLAGKRILDSRSARGAQADSAGCSVASHAGA